MARPDAAFAVMQPAARVSRAFPREATTVGTFRFKHKVVFIANALKHHAVGLEEVADGVWSIYLGNVLLGRLDERS